MKTTRNHIRLPLRLRQPPRGPLILRRNPDWNKLGIHLKLGGSERERLRRVLAISGIDHLWINTDGMVDAYRNRLFPWRGINPALETIFPNFTANLADASDEVASGSDPRIEPEEDECFVGFVTDREFCPHGLAILTREFWTKHRTDTHSRSLAGSVAERIASEIFRATGINCLLFSSYGVRVSKNSLPTEEDLAKLAAITRAALAEPPKNTEG